MSTTAPPVLPISTTVPAAGSVESAQPQIATPAFRAFINRITDTVRNSLSQRRHWAELVDRTAFEKLESFSDATVRVRKNYSYFGVNYLPVVALIVAVSLFTHPFSLVVLLGLLAAWLFLYLFHPSDQPIGPSLDTQTLLGLVALSVFVVFLTSVVFLTLIGWSR